MSSSLVWRRLFFYFFLKFGDKVKTDTERVWKRQVMKEKEKESDYCNNAFELTAD